MDAATVSNAENDGEPRRSPVGVAGLTSAAGCLVLAASLFGFAGSRLWLFDNAANFRVQYCLTLSAAALLLFLLGGRRMALLYGAGALLNLAVIAPLYLGSAATGTGAILRVMQANVHTSNSNYAALSAIVESVNPDVLFLQEVNIDWLAGVSSLHARYPHVVAQPRWDNFGIALYSKRPLLRGEVLRFGSAGVPSIAAKIDWEGTVVNLVATHPLPPISSDYAGLRDDQLSELAGFLGSLHGPIVVAGDLNATPWSSSFSRFLAESGLEDSTLGWGVQPTWPADNYLLSIPIDHVLHSPHFGVSKRFTGPGFESDHYPLVADLRLRFAAED